MEIEIKVVYLEGALMPNNEFMHMGKSLGFITKRQREMVESGATKMTKGKEIIIALKPNEA